MIVPNVVHDDAVGKVGGQLSPQSGLPLVFAEGSLVSVLGYSSGGLNEPAIGSDRQFLQRVQLFPARVLSQVAGQRQRIGSVAAHHEQ